MNRLASPNVRIAQTQVSGWIWPLWEQFTGLYFYFSHKYTAMKVTASHCEKSDLFKLTQCWTKLLLTTEPFTVLKLIISYKSP